MGNLEICRDSPTPLYQQIKQLLVGQITAGTLPPHSRLPSERELVERLGVSRITVRQALGELVQQDFLYTTPSKGFYVAEPQHPFELNALMSFTSIAQERDKKPSNRVLKAEVVAASPALSQKLLVVQGAEVIHLVRLRLLDRVPVIFAQSWLPHARCPDLLRLDLEHISLFGVLRERYGLALTRAHTTVSARLATAREKSLLNLEGDGVVLTMEQTTFTGDDRVAEVSNQVVHPQRFPLSLTHSDMRLTHRTRSS
jgi:GntR family transcriptional regulator